MQTWRLTIDPTASSDATEFVASAGREVLTMAPGDKVALYWNDQPNRGYWGIGEISDAASEEGGTFRIPVRVDIRRVTPVAPQAVASTMKQLRLRSRLLPLDSIKLSPPEFQVLLRLVTKDDQEVGGAAAPQSK